MVQLRDWGEGLAGGGGGGGGGGGEASCSTVLLVGWEGFFLVMVTRSWRYMDRARPMTSKPGPGNLG